MLAPQLRVQKYLAREGLAANLSHGHFPARVLSARATNISLFHLGYALTADSNPITVYISVDCECNEIIRVIDFGLAVT